MRPTVGFVLVRAAGLVLLGVLAPLLVAADDSAGANIGLGVLLLLVPVLAAAVWAAVDGVRSGRRLLPLPPLLVGWAVVAVLVGIGQALQVSATAAVSGGGLSPGALLRDLLALAPFGAVLVGVAADAVLAVTHVLAARSASSQDAASAR